MNEPEKTMLLPRLLRTIAPFAVQDPEDCSDRYQDMTGIRIVDDGKRLEFSATDGRYFGRLTMPKPQAIKAVERFPDVNAVLPKTPAKVVLVIAGERFAQLLLCAQEVSDNGTVMVEIREPEGVVVVRASNEDGSEFVGGIVPCSRS